MAVRPPPSRIFTFFTVDMFIAADRTLLDPNDDLSVVGCPVPPSCSIQAVRQTQAVNIKLPPE